MRASMRRVARASLAAAAVVTLASLASTTGLAQGGGDTANYNAVEMKVNKIGGNFYTIQGSGPDFFPAPNGRPIATIGVLAGPDGIFMVDAGYAPLTEKYVAAIKQISPDG